MIVIVLVFRLEYLHVLLLFPWEYVVVCVFFPLQFVESFLLVQSGYICTCLLVSEIQQLIVDLKDLCIVVDESLKIRVILDSIVLILPPNPKIVLPFLLLILLALINEVSCTKPIMHYIVNELANILLIFSIVGQKSTLSQHLLKTLIEKYRLYRNRLARVLLELFLES